MANENLRRLREAMPSPSGSGRPMTRAELAEAVNQYIWETSGKECHLDVDTVARYERGVVRWPGAVYRDGLRAVLGATTDAKLGFFRTRRGRTAVPDLGSWAARWPALSDSTAGPLSEDGVAGMSALRDAALLQSSMREGTPCESPSLLRRRVVSAFEAYQAGRYQVAAHHAALAIKSVREAPESDPRVEALAYQIGAVLLSKAKHLELARRMANRGLIAARASSDAALHLSLSRTMAFTTAAAGDAQTALAAIAREANEFQPRMSQTPLSASVYGTMLLTGALLSAGGGDHARAGSYLDEAGRAAEVTGTDRNDLWTAFGPSNIAIHRINVAAAAGDMDAVLATGGTVRAQHLPVERQVRLHLDVARASLAVGDREDALATLVRAEMAAPSQVYHHHITHDVVAQLIQSAPRRPGMELSRLASLVGFSSNPI